jgi:phage/plasmid primase-like uncharacterized protein/antirestriction protein ArdC
MAEQKMYVDKLTESVIDDLINGAAPWQQMWKANEIVLPFNPVRETRYTGINLAALMRERMLSGNENDPRYMTPKQAEKNGWRIRDGERGALVQYWQFSRRSPVLDADGKPVLDGDGAPKQRDEALDRPLLRYASVYNGSQVDGITPWNGERQSADPDHSRAEKILRNAGVAIVHDQTERPAYRAGDDTLHIRPQEQYADASAYYADALHTLVYAAAHPDRMNRPRAPKGTEAAARESLRCEIAAWIVAADLGLPFEPASQQALKPLADELRKNPHEVVRACRDAENIVGYIKNLEQTREIPEAEKAAYRSGREGIGDAAPAPEAEPGTKNVLLNVPYEQRYLAKNAGAKWDREKKQWYAPAGSDIEVFKRWMPEKTRPEKPVTSLSPQEEFARALRDMGLDLRGQLPLMDGQIQRVPLIDGSPHKRDGSYKGYLDGIPAGYIENWKTGEKSKWKYSGHMLSGEQIHNLRREAAQRREAEAAAVRERHDRAAKRSYAVWKECAWAQKDHPYLAKKQVESFGVRVDAHGNLIVPGRNAGGMLRTIQTITPEMKKFEAGTEMRGMFHIVDPDKKFERKNAPILIAEGYATAASVHMGTGFPVVCAFNAGNLTVVAANLREKYPDKPIVIMADDDHALPENPGLSKATAAAREVGGIVLTPEFTPEEKSRGLTDFNDLHVSRGLDALFEQLAPAVTRAVESLQAARAPAVAREAEAGREYSDGMSM